MLKQDDEYRENNNVALLFLEAICDMSSQAEQDAKEKLLTVINNAKYENAIVTKAKQLYNSLQFHT